MPEWTLYDYGRDDFYNTKIKIREMKAKKISAKWRVHTPNLLKEILCNNETGAALKIPLNVLGKILAAVGERAAELNDPQLNALMCRLTIYECADPENPNYDKELTEKTINV